MTFKVTLHFVGKQDEGEAPVGDEVFVFAYCTQHFDDLGQWIKTFDKDGNYLKGFYNCTQWKAKWEVIA